jgi:hypothetical protein
MSDSANMKKILKSTARPPEYSPTRTREARIDVSSRSGKILLQLLDDRDIFTLLWDKGFHLIKHDYTPGLDKPRYISFTRTAPHLTDRQRKIMRLLHGWKFMTSQDIARALGLDANNRGVLGRIGHDCEKINTYSRQISRLVGSNKWRVHSFDKLDELKPSFIRAIYRLEASKRKLSRSSTKS